MKVEQLLRSHRAGALDHLLDGRIALLLDVGALTVAQRLDVENERLLDLRVVEEVAEALRGELGVLGKRDGCTEHGPVTILVSHRFSTVRMADVIVVLHDGRIEEQGSHDELLAAGGRYAELFRLQASRY